MKFKVLLLCVVLVFLSAFMLSITCSKDVPSPEEAKLIEKMIVDNEMNYDAARVKRAKESLAGHIIADHKTINDLFMGTAMEAVEQAKITAILDNTVIWTESYHPIRGSKEILKYFENKIAAATNNGMQLTVEITSKNIFLTNAIGEFPIEDSKEDEKYDFFSFENFTFKILTKKKGKLVRNDDGGGSSGRKHIGNCVWGG